MDKIFAAWVFILLLGVGLLAPSQALNTVDEGEDAASTLSHSLGRTRLLQVSYSENYSFVPFDHDLSSSALMKKDSSSLRQDIFTLVDANIKTELTDHNFEEALRRLRNVLQNSESSPDLEKVVDFFRSHKDEIVTKVLKQQVAAGARHIENIVRWLSSPDVSTTTFPVSLPNIVTYYHMRNPQYDVYADNILCATSTDLKTFPEEENESFGNQEVEGFFLNFSTELVDHMRFQLRSSDVPDYGGSAPSFQLSFAVNVSNLRNAYRAVLKKYFGREYVMVIRARPDARIRSLALSAILAHEYKHYLDVLTNPKIFDINNWKKARQEALAQENPSDERTVFSGDAYVQRLNEAFQVFSAELPNTSSDLGKIKLARMFKDFYRDTRNSYLNYFLRPWEESAFQEQCRYLKFGGMTKEEVLAEPERYFFTAGKDEIGYFQVGQATIATTKEKIFYKTPAYEPLGRYFEKCMDETLVPTY